MSTSYKNRLKHSINEKCEIKSQYHRNINPSFMFPYGMNSIWGNGKLLCYIIKHFGHHKQHFIAFHELISVLLTYEIFSNVTTSVSHFSATLSRKFIIKKEKVTSLVHQQIYHNPSRTTNPKPCSPEITCKITHSKFSDKHAFKWTLYFFLCKKRKMVFTYKNKYRVIRMKTRLLYFGRRHKFDRRKSKIVPRYIGLHNAK